MIRLAEEKDKQAWDNFLQQSPHGTFLQNWAWGELQKKLSIPIWRYIVEQDTRWQAVALVVKRQLPWGKLWLYVPRGPVGSWTDIKPALSKVAYQEKAMFVRIDPTGDIEEGELAKEWRKAQREVQPQHTLVIDLRQTEDELLAAMHHKTRYNIRLAQKKGVKVRFSTEAKDLEHFLTLAHDVHERSAFHYHPADYYRALVEVLGAAGQLEIALAEYEHEILAAHLIITFHNTTTYAHGASSSKARSVMAPHLLQWETMQRAKQKGQHWYDFYGVAMQGKLPAWAGITRFKEGFGGQHRSYKGAYDFVLDRFGYWAYNTMHRLRK